MSGDARVRWLAALIGAAGAVALLALGSRAIGSGPVAFAAPGPLDAGLATTSLRVDALKLRPAADDGLQARIDLAVTNVGPHDAVGVGYVLEDNGIVVDYKERDVLSPGRRDRAVLTWTPRGHDAHTLRVVVGDGNVHWVKHQLRTGVFAPDTLGFRRHRSPGAFFLTALAGALIVVTAGAVTPHLLPRHTIEVVYE